MPFRLTLALCIILLAGCTSSEPQNISPAPLAESTAVPGVPTPAFAGQTVGDTGQIPAADPMGTAATQHGYNCRTVGNATMCDAPAIPATEDRLYTN